MNKMKIKIFTLLSLLITFSLALSSCDSLWDDLNSITVSFDSNSGTGTMEPQEFEADVPQTLKENTFTREGYTFAGWATSADATTAEYADKAEFTAKEDITLYAIWNIIPPVNPPAPEPSKVTITYVSDKGTLPESKTVEQGYKLTAEDLPTLTETGYRFINWDKAIDDEITSDTTITASWIKTWAISYASNKSELNDKLPASKTVDEGYKLTADDLTALTADGYNFKGWDKSAGLEIKADVTITATWKKLVTISYSLPTGYSKDPKTVEEGYTLTAEDLPNETDTEYGTWDKTVGTEINTNTTITATKWEDIVYLKKLTSISEISSNKAKIEKIVFTSDTYSGAATTIACADNSTNPAIPTDYFKGVLTNGTVSGQYILTIYGNGHRIYAPADCNQLFIAFSKASSIEFNNFYTSKVTDMTCMFAGCYQLATLDLSSFNTSSVTTMKQMFYSCYVLSPLNLSKFDTSSVTDMSQMFRSCKALVTLDLSSFDTSSVKDMSYMFEQCNALTSLNVKNFNTSSVENMSCMFQQCKAFTSLDLSSFDTKSVKDMSYMFKNCEALLTLDLSNFDTSSVENMTHMISYCSALTKLDLSKFDTKSVKTMKNMFTCSKAITELIIKFDTEAVTDMSYMFAECNALKELDISTFTKNAGLSDITNMFKSCKALEKIYVNSNFDLSDVTTGTDVFTEDIKLVGGAGTKYSDAETSDPTNYKTAAYAHIDGGTGNPGYFTLKP